jgi:hypothetical protein
VIQNILPHLGDFIDTHFTPDGDSGRSIDVPLHFPQSLSPDDLPVFINQIVGLSLAGQNNLYAVFNVTVRSYFYYIPVGQDIPLKNQYDLYHYAGDYLQAIINNPRLNIPGTGELQGIDKAVTIGNPKVPATIPYPPDDTQGVQYTGATFDLIIPIQVVRC